MTVASCNRLADFADTCSSRSRAHGTVRLIRHCRATRTAYQPVLRGVEWRLTPASTATKTH